MSSDFTFGDNSDEFSIFQFILNLADREIRVSDHSDTDVVMTARTSGADKGESDCSYTRNALDLTDKEYPTVKSIF